MLLESPTAFRIRCRTTGQRCTAHPSNLRGGIERVLTKDGRVTKPTLVFVSLQPDQPEPPFIAHDDAWVPALDAGWPFDVVKVLEVRDLLQLRLAETLADVEVSADQRAVTGRVDEHASFDLALGGRDAD
jgi:hypothetical protein